MKTKNISNDAVLAKLLANLPALRHWSNEPLDVDLQHLIKTADSQTLMSLAVRALDKLGSSRAAGDRINR